MRLEVLVGDEDPVVYQLNSPKMTLGSSEHCDIVVNTDGVSRKHVGILNDNDQFFIVDLGSTNGSFINEERLIPGKRVEFTSFFPVRLGQNVLLSLLSDEEITDEEGQEKIEIPSSFKEPKQDEPKKPLEATEKTTVISLRDLNNVKTEKLILVRNEKRAAKKKVEKPKAKKKVNVFPFVALLIFFGGAAYNILSLKNEEAQDEVPAEVGQITTAPENSTGVTPEPTASTTVSNGEKSRLIPEEELSKKDSYYERLNELKCASDLEVRLCDFFPQARGSVFGVVQVGLSLHIMVNAEAYYSHAKSVVKAPVMNSVEALKKHEELVYDTTAYLYLLRSHQNWRFDLSKFQDFKFFIALFLIENESSPRLLRVIAITPQAFAEVKEILTEKHLNFIKASGEAAFSEVKNYYRTY